MFFWNKNSLTRDKKNVISKFVYVRYVTVGTMIFHFNIVIFPLDHVYLLKGATCV